MFTKLLKTTFLVAVLLSATSFPSIAEELKVGMLIPLSGPFAPIGEDTRQGMEIALDQSGTRDRLKIVFADSMAEPKSALSEYRKLTSSDHVSAIYTIRSPIGMALNPLSQSSGLPLLGGVGHSDFTRTNKYALQAWSSSAQEGGFLADKIREHGYKKIAVVTTQDDWTLDVSGQFNTEFVKAAGTILYNQEVLPSETDFRTVVLQLKSKNPEVLFVNLILTQIGPFLRQVREQKLDTPIFSNFWVAKKDVVESAGIETVEGVRFAEMNTDLPTLRREVESRFSSTPSGATLSAYAATFLLAQTLIQNPGISTSSELYQALLRQSNIRTPDESLPIIDRRIQFPLRIRIMKNGRPTEELISARN